MRGYAINTSAAVQYNSTLNDRVGVSYADSSLFRKGHIFNSKKTILNENFKQHKWEMLI